MSKAEAVQESQEDIDARLAEEAALSGEDYTPPEDTKADVPAASTSKLTDAGADVDAEAAKAKPEYDADTLAAIAGDDKPKTVPHSRFNEVNEEAKLHRARVLALEEELARMKGAAPVAPKKEEAPVAAYDFDDAEDRYASALLDGESAKAKEIRREIRAREQEAADKRAEELADRRYKTNKAADDAQRTKLEFDVELNKAYAAFPFLNAESVDKNQDAIDEVLVWQQSFLSKGGTAAEALAAAVKKIAPRFVKAADEPAPAAAAAPKPDLQKGIDRAARVPEKPQGLGARASTLDVSKMSGKDLKALSAEDEASLAGDIV